MITLDQIRFLKKRAGWRGALFTWAVATVAIEVEGDDETLNANERFGDSSLTLSELRKLSALSALTGSQARAACEVILTEQRSA